MEKYNKNNLNNIICIAITDAAKYVFGNCVKCPAGQYTAASINKALYGAPRTRDYRFSFDDASIKDGCKHEISGGVWYDGGDMITINFEQAAYTCTFCISRVFALADRFLKLADDAKVKKYCRKIFVRAEQSEHDVEFTDDKCYSGQAASGACRYYLILAHNRNVVTVLDGDTGNISQCAAFWRGGEQMANIQTADGLILLNAASVISSEC